jgi:hypothetical protein
MQKLLSRNEFRESALDRDNNQCVVCFKPAVDVHHIIERKLFNDGGYYLDNAASLCEQCHIKAEQTEISVKELLGCIEVSNPILPHDFCNNSEYDKWGNPILPNGNRMKGPMFFEENVQKILKDRLHLFVDYIKYPRTYHFPWSSWQNDDKVMDSIDSFIGKRVVITEKLDGENTTLYRNHYHARSLDSKNHPSRNWAKAFHAGIAHDIPEGYRICCENMYAVHSIRYENLQSYLYGLSIWDQTNTCLSWRDTYEIFDILGIPTPEIFYCGEFDAEYLEELGENLNSDICEGYVVRVVDSFKYKDFKYNVGKYVRKNHIQTDQHWMDKEIEKNGTINDRKQSY